jgi:D-serine deaminase-like pyridoxal phosphate-dependent protein
MFGDLFQAAIGTHGLEDIAVTVLAAVIGRSAARNTLLLDAGALALSKDRSTAAVGRDWGFGRVLDRDGRATLGEAWIDRAYQEHGEVKSDRPLPMLPLGARLRVAPNHTCLTAAAHGEYHVVDGGEAVIATWGRVNGW